MPQVPNIIARFVYERPSPLPGVTVSLNDASYVRVGAVVAWLWDFGDGGTSTMPNPTHVYAAEGKYNVTLTVTDDMGETNSVQIIMEVRTPDFTIHQEAGVTQAINSLGVVEMQATDPTGVINYAIDKCGMEASQANPKFIFIEDGVYYIQTGSQNPSDASEWSGIWFWNYSDITLEGQSWNTKLETRNKKHDCIRFLGFTEYGGPNQRIRIANLSINGGANSEHPTWDMQNGIQTGNTKNSIWETLYIHHMGRTGMYNTEGSDGCIIRNCVLTDNWRYGCSYTSSGQGHVHNNVFGNNHGWCLNIDGTYGPADGTVAEYNLFLDTPYICCQIISEQAAGISNVTFQKNILIANPYTGLIKTTFAKGNILIQHNYCEFNGSGQQIIMIQDQGQDNRIIGNHFVLGPNAWCTIYIDEGANNKILENTFIGQEGIVIGGDVQNTLIDYNDFTQVTGTILENHSPTTTFGPHNLMPGALVANANGPYSVPQDNPTINFVGSASGGTPPYSWLWDFGDGQTSNLQNPTHTYPTTPGTYTVTLTVTDAVNNSHSDSTTATITPVAPPPQEPPVAQFAHTFVPPLTVQFTDQSQDPDGTVVAWAWDFGDGGTSVEQHPTHVYASEGTYTVTLTVTDNDGLTATSQKTVTVAPPTLPLIAIGAPITAGLILAAYYWT